ncbi:hypothetical protein Lalb_Chr02g0160111 [Lupinus albus]|uniref:Uncharacterized protein n=1 Tax=Lupinus albus TaxID=3870 RepID=A0A6A4R3Y9_LUPAL|nr:hypothetical protein Lalb_Chr02g0160111 [Lupinus albus]
MNPNLYTFLMMMMMMMLLEVMVKDWGRMWVKRVRGDARNQGFHWNEVNASVDLQGNNGKRKMRMKTVAKKGCGNRMRCRQGGLVLIMT